MATARSIVLECLPKVALSRACGFLCSLPLPRSLRGPLFRWFARRYGADLDQVDGDLASFRSMQEFFRRSLRAGARPIAPGTLVWPCDGRIVTAGPIAHGRIPQVKGHDYQLADLVGDAALAAALEGGSQATIYLAPGDYHRVHAPFAASIDRVQALPGTLFPVNPPAVRCVRNLFARNARHVFHCRLPGDIPAAVVLVGAYNVGGTRITRQHGDVRAGDEIGQFGFGSTVIALVGRSGPAFVAAAPEQVVRMGGAAAG
ncbi:MAG: phosphatidylserine decarboxylase [Planctomycetes bacterium]|nr:phosphatidylserine decarboxylase [Planctomycetota bacterium]